VGTKSVPTLPATGLSVTVGWAKAKRCPLLYGKNRIKFFFPQGTRPPGYLSRLDAEIQRNKPLKSICHNLPSITWQAKALANFFGHHILTLNVKFESTEALTNENLLNIETTTRLQCISDEVI